MDPNIGINFPPSSDAHPIDLDAKEMPFAGSIKETHNAQGTLAAAQALSQAMASDKLNDQEKRRLYGLMGQLVDKLARELGQQAHGRLSGSSSCNQGVLDTPIEYQAAVAAAASIFEHLPDSAPGQADAQSTQFSKDVLANMHQAPDDAGTKTSLLLGRYGTDLIDLAANKGGALAQSAAQALKTPDVGKQGIFEVPQNDREKAAANFLSLLHAEQTKANSAPNTAQPDPVAPRQTWPTEKKDQTAFIGKSGTWFAVLGRRDVQMHLGLSPAQMNEPDAQRLNLALERFKHSPTGAQFDFSLLGNKKGGFITEGKEGKRDPDFFDAHRATVIENDQGEKLTLLPNRRP